MPKRHPSKLPFLTCVLSSLVLGSIAVGSFVAWGAGQTTAGASDYLAPNDAEEPAAADSLPVVASDEAEEATAASTRPPSALTRVPVLADAHPTPGTTATTALASAAAEVGTSRPAAPALPGLQSPSPDTRTPASPKAAVSPDASTASGAGEDFAATSTSQRTSTRHRHVTLGRPVRFQPDPAGNSSAALRVNDNTTEDASVGAQLPDAMLPALPANLPTGETAPPQPADADADRPTTDPETTNTPEVPGAADPAERDVDEEPVGTDDSTAPSQRPPAERIVSFFNIGWSNANPEKRNIGRYITNRGWTWFVATAIQPQVRRGVTRFQLHNPWGALAGEPMQLDQLLHAREIGLTSVTEGFVDAWKPLTEAGIEVIGYVGSGRGDPDFEVLEADEEAWIDRAMLSVQPLLDAGMDIGLDASAPAAITHPVYEFAQRLREQGVVVYVEAKPDRDKQHWFDHGVICIDGIWLRSDVHTGHRAAQLHYGIENHLLTGEVLRLVLPRTGESWKDLRGDALRSRVQEILGDGQNALVSLQDWFRDGRTLANLVDLSPSISFD